MARPPLSLPPTSDTPLEVTLLIGSPIYSPLSVSLFDLILPASHPVVQHPDEASFHPLPQIHHTFRPDQKLPPRPISAVFSLLVLAPWFVLLGMVRISYFAYSHHTHPILLVEPSCSPGSTPLLSQHLPVHCDARCLRRLAGLVLG